MAQLITDNIKVSVVARYQPEHSQPTRRQYIFSYRIRIENLGSQTVQLLRRHWIITDGYGAIREVEGDGVIGRQPVLAPGQRHQYDSWCPLPTPQGFMEGTYLMRQVDLGHHFQVGIPRFDLRATILDN